MTMIGERIQRARRAAPMTQRELAVLMHVSRQTISSWETGHSYPDISSLVMLSEHLHLTTDALLKEDTGLLMRLRERDQTLRRVRRMGWVAMGIDMLLMVGFAGSTWRWSGFALGGRWEGLLMVVLGLNIVIMAMTSLWDWRLHPERPQSVTPRAAGIVVASLVGAISLGLLLRWGCQWGWWSIPAGAFGCALVLGRQAVRAKVTAGKLTK
ncbi:helix-turn-helix domain-containing protein [Lacticaseibacillus absianus]|uniref:helix-turn-helix domain-containing protein n=1 Tax=Lacticaseibacillus absianus TaxID=2729623 RepID=UPI0015CC734A|nr:helix-turn-helix transcriptional regulator [Lacticaseibacillus absianus]